MATHGNLLDRMCACSTKADACDLVTRETENVLAQRPELVREQARDIVMHNIGYLTGYCDRREAARLLDLFDARHPFLGAAADWPSDPQEVFDLGAKVAMQRKAGA